MKIDSVVSLIGMSKENPYHFKYIDYNVLVIYFSVSICTTEFIPGLFYLGHSVSTVIPLQTENF